MTVLLIAMVSVGATSVAADDWWARSSEAIEALPPLPSPQEFPVQLVLDDDGSEGAVGVGISTAQQFLWLNRFSPAERPFALEQIWVLFPADPSIGPGDSIELVAYLDPDGDPTNGATWLGSWNETVQVADGNTFSVYALPSALDIVDDGDVLLGVVARFIVSGVDPPIAPAAIDTTASQGRSWLATWTGDPPSPPMLPSDGSIDLIDTLQPGNWMIRGFGGSANVLVIPTLDSVGAAVLFLVLSLVGWRVIHGSWRRGEVER